MKQKNSVFLIHRASKPELGRVTGQDGLARDALVYGFSKRFELDYLQGDEVEGFEGIQPIRRDPLVLDLDGDGLETTGINTTSPILFDHDGDGVQTATGWVQADDAFLVYDRDENGTIDNGHELFGDATPLNGGSTAADGFAALAQEDTNSDGLVNADDAHWADLRLWRDLNQDGVSQENELFTLDSQGIAALKVGSTDRTQTLPNGNQLADLGGYIKTDGSSGTLGEVTAELGDINLASNPFYSQFTDSIPLTGTAQTLPDMQGSGLVRSLREAASLGTADANTLAGLLQQVQQATSATAQRALLDSILIAWGKTSTLAASGTAGAYGGLPTTITIAGTTGNQLADLADIKLASNPFYSQPCDNGPAMRSLFIGLRADTENGYADDLHNATRATNEQNYWRVA